MEKLLPCPFCGGKPNIEPWHGGEPTKKMVSCPGVYANSVMGRCNNAEIICKVAPIVTGETKKEAIKNWNTRSQPKYKRVDLDEDKCSVKLFSNYGSNFTRGYNQAIDDIKAKFGDLYVLTKEGE